MLDVLWRDLRAGVRAHSRTPVMTAVAVSLLALGIAATSVSFSIADAFFLRPLPIADTDRFVHIFVQSAAAEPFPISYPDYEDVRALTGVFAGAVAEAPAPLIIGGRASTPERVWGEIVSDDYFQQLGVGATRGRVFTAAEDAVVLSDGLWRRRFGADPAIVGTTLEIEGRPFRVAGIAAATFRGTIVGFSADMWLPLRAASLRTADSPMRDDADNRAERNYFVMARLAPGMGIAQARTALAALADRLARDFPATNAGMVLTALSQSEGRFPTVRSNVFGFSMLTVAIAVLMTLIAGANVAGVLLARSASRRAEVGVRLALGASRRRIVAQLLTESASMSLLAGGLGILAAWQATALLSGFEIAIARGATAGVDVTLDYRVLAISVLLTMVMALLCGLTPALESSRTDLVGALRSGARTEPAARSRSRRLLLTAQVAVAMLLLAGGGLFVRSLHQARQVDLGFAAGGVVTAAVEIRARGDARAPGDPLWTTMLETVRALPQTESAAMTWRLPLELGITRMPIAPESFTPAPGRDWPVTEFSTVTPGYFAIVGIPLVGGRDFDSRDNAGAPKAIIVNDVLASRLWPGQTAVGRHLITPGGGRLEVIGVARRSKYFSIGEGPTAYAYIPLPQSAPRAMTIVARGRGDRRAYGEAIGATVRRLDRTATVDIGLLSDRVRLALAPAAGSAAAVGIVSLLALGLTCLGLFAAVAQTVGRRTYEIGVRRALGAPDRSVAVLVLGETFVLVAWGLGLGLATALAASRPLRALLYGVDVADPVVFGAAPLVLLAVCLLAMWLPTWRALRISAATALRYE